MELDVFHCPADQEEFVGRLLEDRRGQVFFEYAASWREGSRQLSPLFLPNDTLGAVTTPTPDFGPLFGLFADALPDWWGERLMRRFFADQGLPWQRVGALQKLSCQGDRKMGALVFRPVADDSGFNAELAVRVDDLMAEAEHALQGEATGMMERLVRSGLSAGGAQPKALLCFDEDFQEGRIADPAPDGFASWLVKFDFEPDLQWGRVEYAFALMARAAGIEMAESRLLPGAGGRAHFATRRFDRPTNGAVRRLHLHSFSGLAHRPVRDGFDYRELMNLARQLTGGHDAVEQIFRRAAFNIAAGNDDDHARNHAFLMEAEGRWSLAPAYDLTPVSNPLTSGIRAGTVMGKGAGLRESDLRRLADDQGVRHVSRIFEEVRTAVAAWPDWAAQAGVGAANASMLQPPGLPDDG